MHKSNRCKTFALMLSLGISILFCACVRNVSQTDPNLTHPHYSANLDELYAERKSNRDQLSSNWLKCLAPFYLRSRQDQLKGQIQTKQNKQTEEASLCYSLLTRPSLDRRPKFLNRSWLIINAQEHMRPSIGVQSKLQRQLGPLKTALNQGDWSLKVTLIRLPPYQDQAQGVENKQKDSLPKQHAPSPLKLWANAEVNKASLSEWTQDGLQEQVLPLEANMKLNQMPTPRVGQVLHLELSQKPPQILRGAWAWHHQLWFNVPMLRRSFTFNAPRAIKLSYFGDSYQNQRKENYGQLLHWERFFQSSGEGGNLYISTMSSWSKLHRWLWNRFNLALQKYKKGLTQHLNSKLFKYFLYPRDSQDIHRWLRQNFKYQPQSKTPYNPQPIIDFLKSKQGDCKEFSTLAQVLLELQGQSTFFALTSSKPIPRYALNTPSIGWFNHVLLWQPSAGALRLAKLHTRGQSVVSLGLTTHQWFDPTSSILGRAPKGLAYVLLGPQQGVWIAMDH